MTIRGRRPVRGAAVVVAGLLLASCSAGGAPVGAAVPPAGPSATGATVTSVAESTTGAGAAPGVEVESAEVPTMSSGGFSLPPGLSGLDGLAEVSGLADLAGLGLPAIDSTAAQALLPPDIPLPPGATVTSGASLALSVTIAGDLPDAVGTVPFYQQTLAANGYQVLSAQLGAAGGLTFTGSRIAFGQILVGQGSFLIQVDGWDPAGPSEEAPIGSTDWLAENFADAQDRSVGPGQTLTLDESTGEYRVHCDGGDISVEAANVLIHVTGDCASATFSAGNITAWFESVDSLTLTTDSANVTVVHAGGDPQVLDQGMNNSVTAG